MFKKINQILSVMIGASAGVFIGYGLYTFWDFKNHPGLYAMQSAPWYTGLLMRGAVTAIVIAVAVIIKIIIRRRMN